MSEVTATDRPAKRGGASRLVSDDRLAQRATSGDQRAFEAIYRRYHRDLYRFCLTMVGNPQDAQDTLQNTMVKVLRALPGEERRIQLRSWLYRIAHNEAVEIIRGRREAAELESDQVASTLQTADTAAARERLRQVIADLGELPERQRAALVMRELAGLGFAQIGETFDTSEAVVRQTIYEARRSLRQMEEGREMDCETIMREISDGDRRVIRRRQVRAHLRDCPDCQAFRDSIEERRNDLAAIAPLPLAASAGLLHGILGAGSGASAGTGAAAGSGLGGAIAGGAGKAVATSTIVKSAATVAVVTALGVSAGDRIGLIDAPVLGGGQAGNEKAAPASSRSVAPHERVAAARRGQARSGAPATAADPRSGRSSGKDRASGGSENGHQGRHGSDPTPTQSHSQAASRAGQHGRPEGLPAASDHGQQTAAAHKPPQAQSTPGPSLQGGGRSTPHPSTPPPSNPPVEEPTKPATPSKPAPAGPPAPDGGRSPDQKVESGNSHKP